MVSYVLRMMTSWAIVVNVWYLPPMTIRVRPQPSPNVHRLLLPGVFICRVLCEQEGEDAAQFANRVKSAIAHQGGLLDLPWWVHLLTDATSCWELSVLSLTYFSQGRRPQTTESEGFLQRGAAEDVQQHHRGTERHLAGQVLWKHRGRWGFRAVAMITPRPVCLQTVSSLFTF